MVDRAFLDRLRATFRVEAAEHIDAMTSGLGSLQENPENLAEIVEHIFREAHSLKGAARAVNMTQIESACQSLESLFSDMKSGRVTPSVQILGRIQESIDDIAGLLREDGAPIRSHEIETPPPAPPPVDKVAPQLRNSDAGGQETVRISVDRLGVVMRRAEGLLSSKLSAQQRLKDMNEILALLAEAEKRRSEFRSQFHAYGKDPLRSQSDRLAEYLETEMQTGRALKSRVGAARQAAERDCRALSAMVDELLDDAREMLMTPFSTLSDGFPRFVREISRAQGKRMELDIQGGEIEIDRRILEEIKDPLIHLLRNAADHGMERPEIRQGKNKPCEGRIVIALTQKDGGKVEVVVSDDGVGIDVEKVKASGSRLGLVSDDDRANLIDSEVISLVFRSGVSTSPIITEISGRGLGLAIVQEKIERLGGSVSVETGKDRGTTFRLSVPLSLATFRGVLVRSGERAFALPLRHVERVMRIARKNIVTLENRETITVAGQAVPWTMLSEVLELEDREADRGSLHAVILGRDGNRIAFGVEDIIGEQEVVLKTLGRQLSRVRNVAGACVLGTGEVIPVLNASDLMKSAVRQSGKRLPRKEAVAGREKAILVVEDSITSRTLLKSILESAGYRVATAVDGIDALGVLKSESFDLVVSDVDMPKMNGFDLAASIRADKQLSELPIVLVTALGSREHRERGMAVGANAYIVKSSFDQSDLIEVVGRLA